MDHPDPLTPAEDDYFTRPEINREDLLLFRRSPSLYHAIKTGGIAGDEVKQVMDLVDPPGGKLDAFAVGEGVHRLVFEPDTVDERFHVIDRSVLTSNGQRRGKKWDEYKALHESKGKCLVTQGQLSLMHMVSRSAKRTLETLLVPSAIFEKPLYWSEELENGESVTCRAKPDYMLVVPGKKFGLILDLKTCQTLDDFHYSVRKYNYWMQEVHYTAGFKCMFGFEPEFYFVAVEKIPPFRSRLFSLSDRTRSKASEIRESLLLDISNRRLSGDWTDPVDTEVKEIHIEL